MNGCGAVDIGGRERADLPSHVRFNCCLDAAMTVVEGRWKGTILCMLHINDGMRFSELQRAIGSVSSRILSKQLKELEDDGMISRTVGSDRKLRVTYSLTDKGESILPALAMLAEWGAYHQVVRVILPESIGTVEPVSERGGEVGIPEDEPVGERGMSARSRSARDAPRTHVYQRVRHPCIGIKWHTG